MQNYLVSNLWPACAVLGHRHCCMGRGPQAALHREGVTCEQGGRRCRQRGREANVRHHPAVLSQQQDWPQKAFPNKKAGTQPHLGTSLPYYICLYTSKCQRKCHFVLEIFFTLEVCCKKGSKLLGESNFKFT